MTKLKFLLMLMMVMVFLLYQCSLSNDNETDNPVPTLAGISPSSKVSHMPSFTLTAIGSDFVRGSIIVFDGIERSTAFLNSFQLTCQINPDDIDPSTSSAEGNKGISGVHSTDIPVLVRNPAPGVGDSGIINFSIRESHTFNASKNISNTSGPSHQPCVTLDSTGNINVLWHDKISGLNYDIFLIRSSNNGVSFGAKVNVSDNWGHSTSPAIALDNSGNIFAAWEDDTPGHLDILLRSSTDNGSSFSTAVNISDNPSYSYCPSLALDNQGNLNVVWMDSAKNNYEIFFSHSADHGSNFGAAVNISNNLGYSEKPTVAVDSTGNIYVAWVQGDLYHDEIFISRSADNGASFSPVVNVSHSGGALNPDIAVDNSGSINVIWCDYSTGDDEIFFSRSTDKGSTFSPAVNVSNGSGWSRDPVLAVDNAGNINVVWSSDKGSGINSDILFSRSTDNGSTFSPAFNITGNTNYSENPAIALDIEGNIYLVWVETLPGGIDIYFISSVF